MQAKVNTLFSGSLAQRPSLFKHCKSLGRMSSQACFPGGPLASCPRHPSLPRQASGALCGGRLQGPALRAWEWPRVCRKHGRSRSPGAQQGQKGSGQSCGRHTCPLNPSARKALSAKALNACFHLNHAFKGAGRRKEIHNKEIKRTAKCRLCKGGCCRCF